MIRSAGTTRCPRQVVVLGVVVLVLVLGAAIWVLTPEHAQAPPATQRSSPTPVSIPTVVATPPVPTSTVAPMASIPAADAGDCGAIEIAVCEQAVFVAITHWWNSGPPPTITDWEVRPTEVRVCSGVEPRYDVEFVFEIPRRLTIVTVGVVPTNGVWTVCTF